MKSSLILLPAALVLLAMPSAQAVVYAYEGFAGYAAGTLSPQTISSSTTGLNTATTITSGGGANGLAANTWNGTGLTFSNLAVSGGKGLYDSSTGAASYIGYAYNGTTVVGTLYTSYLTNIATTQNSASVVSLRANLTSTSAGSASYFGSYADSNGSTFTGSQYDNNNLNTASAQTLATGITYAVIGRFTNVGTALSAGTPGAGTTYVLSAAQFDFFKAGGFDDAELDGAAIGTAAGEVTSRVSDANVTTGTWSLASGNAIQFGPGNAAVQQTVSYDEIRFGSSLNDVLPIPEPSTALLLLGALLAGPALRRRA